MYDAHCTWVFASLSQGSGFDIMQLMALKPCRECKKKVSTEAVSCPNCGVPNPTLTLKIKPNYGFVRCEKSFCKNRFKLLEIPKSLISVQECQLCGNKMEKVKNEDAIKDIEKRQKKSQTSITNNHDIPSVNSRNLSNSNGEYFFNGTKSLAETFWLYFFVGNKVFVLFEYLLLKNESEVAFFYFVVILHIIWTALSVMGVFNSANIYKAKKIKLGQTYGYATAAKIASVLLILSSIGNAL